VGTYGLSAHADTGQLVSAISSAKPRQVFLVHGDGGARQALADALVRVGINNIERPKLGQSFEIETRPKRRGLRKKSPSCASVPEADRKQALTFDDLFMLAQRLLDRDRNKRSYTTRQVIEEWGDPVGAQDADERQRVAELLKRKDGPFTGKKGRYRIRHNGTQVIGGKTKTRDAKGRLIAAKAADRVREVLCEPTLGLYKVGQHPGRGVLKLYFHFPYVAVPQVEARLEALTEETGWRMEVNDRPHLETLFEEVHKALGVGVGIEGVPSQHFEQHMVSITLSVGATLPDDIDARRKRFKARTGFSLIVDDVVPSAPTKSRGKLRQNDALEQVRLSLGDMPGFIKVGARAGALVIRFITPELATTCTEVLNELEEKTGWSVQVHPHHHQQMLVGLAVDLLPDEVDVQGTSFHVDRKTLSVKLGGCLSRQHLREVKRDFGAQTGGWPLDVQANP